MTDAIDAMVTLKRMSERLRAAPDALRDCMPELARVVRDYLRECAARGVDPDGTPWPPNVDGSRSSISGSHLDVVTTARKIIVTVKWYNALHSRGHAKGGKRRALIPAGEIPAELMTRMNDVVTRRLGEALEL